MMQLRNVRVDEARLRKISSSFKNDNAIDQWLQLIVDNAVDDLETLAAAPVSSLQKYPFDRDMTPEELYAAIIEDAKAIYSE